MADLLLLSGAYWRDIIIRRCWIRKRIWVQSNGVTCRAWSERVAIKHSAGDHKDLCMLYQWFRSSLACCLRSWIERIITIIGFDQTFDRNYTLLRCLENVKDTSIPGYCPRQTLLNIKLVTLIDLDVIDNIRKAQWKYFRQ